MMGNSIMSSVPKVSIFTAVKNGGRFAADTIESVLNQSFKDWEHVIVDGASTDNTLEIIKNYPHIRWIRSQTVRLPRDFTRPSRCVGGNSLPMLRL